MPHLQLTSVELTPEQSGVIAVALLFYADKLKDLLASPISDNERLIHQSTLSDIDNALAKIDPKHFPKSQ